MADAERAVCKLWWNHDGGEKQAFTPIPDAVDHLTLESVNRLTREHELKSYLNNCLRIAAA